MGRDNDGYGDQGTSGEMGTGTGGLSDSENEGLGLPSLSSLTAKKTWNSVKIGLSAALVALGIVTPVGKVGITVGGKMFTNAIKARPAIENALTQYQQKHPELANQLTALKQSNENITGQSAIDGAMTSYGMDISGEKSGLDGSYNTGTGANTSGGNTMLDILFGSEPEVTTTAGTSKQTAEQQSLMQKLMSYYQSFAGQSGEQYSGDRVAGLDSSGVEGELGGTLGILNQFESGAFTQPKYLEDYYTKSIEEPLMKRWKEEIMPTIGGEFETRGLFMGSGRRDAEVNSAEALMDTMGKGRANLYSQMEKSGRAQQLQASTMKSQTLAQMLGISAAQTGIEQQGMDTQYSDWLRTQPGSRPQDQILMQLLGLNTLNAPNTVVTGGSSGIAPSLIETIGTIGGAFL